MRIATMYVLQKTDLSEGALNAAGRVIHQIVNNGGEFDEEQLTLPPRKIDKYLRKTRYTKRINHTSASAYLASVVEYLISELMTSAGYVARLCKEESMRPKHIMHVIKKNEDFFNFFGPKIQK